MKCTLCGFEFNEEDVRSSCGGCYLAKRCELLKCPNCGFEMTTEPKWIKNRRRKKNDLNR